MNRIVNADELAAPVGFSHAVVAGETIYLGGQAAQAPSGEIVGESVIEQFDVAAGNVMTALRAAGGSADDLVSLQIFVTDVAEYRASMGDLGPIWRKHFGRHYPAVALFGIAELFDPAAKVELMAIAVRSA
jgi:enamine deaminase RidA (YjgF/YER057c/UK114 family)